MRAVRAVSGQTKLCQGQERESVAGLSSYFKVYIQWFSKALKLYFFQGLETRTFSQERCKFNEEWLQDGEF